MTLMIVLTWLVASGCSGGNEGSTNEGTDNNAQEEASGEQIELRWAMWTGTQEEQEVWETLADMVTEEYPNITVKFETDSFLNYWDKLQSQLASGTAPDIISLQSMRTGTFGPRDAFEPLDTFIENTPEFEIEDFEESILEGLSWDGNQLAIPYDFGPYILYYNKDIFDQYGVEYPDENMTWDEFLEKAKATTQGEHYGFTMMFAQNTHVIPFIWSNGGDFMDEDAAVSQMADPKTMEAVQFISDMMHEHKVIPPISDPGNETLYRDQFYAGKVAMYIDGPWNFGNIRSKADFDWDITTFPEGSSGSITPVAGSGFGIYTGSEKKEEAWKALTVILGKEGFEYLASTGRAFPARKSAFDTFASVSDEPENLEAISQAGEEGRPLVTTTNWQEADKMMVRELDNIWFNNAPVEEVLERIDTLFQELLDEHQENISK